MYNYYCKNCCNILGKWHINKFLYVPNCTFIKSKNINLVFFLDCKKCNKFIGIFCNRVCEICFGKDEIIGEEKIKKWFLEYKKIKPLYSFDDCKNCNKNNFRYQFWFFKELTFINNNIN